jgi:ferredoxin-NADP reductase
MLREIITMQEIKGKLIERIKRTSDIESFRFGFEKDFDFIPGQFVRVLFDPQNRDNRELNKYLSFSCSPTRPYREFTKRLSQSSFSRRLQDLKAGDEVLFKGPMGNCVFNKEYKKIGFLIGGIGITPVISIIEYIVEKGLDTDVVLLYSNRTESDVAFKDELDSWRSGKENIQVFYTITDCQPQDKRCISGVIDKDVLLEKAPDRRGRTFYMVGPPKMVESMKQLCLDAGCDPQLLKTENFIGY